MSESIQIFHRNHVDSVFIKFTTWNKIQTPIQLEDALRLAGAKLAPGPTILETFLEFETAEHRLLFLMKYS